MGVVCHMGGEWYESFLDKCWLLRWSIFYYITWASLYFAKHTMLVGFENIDADRELEKSLIRVMTVIIQISYGTLRNPDGVFFIPPSRYFDA